MSIINIYIKNISEGNDNISSVDIKNNFGAFSADFVENMIEGADKIVVLDNGHVHDVGTHTELLKRCEIYRDIYLSQTKTEGA